MKSIFEILFCNDKSTAKDEYRLIGVLTVLIIIAVLIMVFLSAMPAGLKTIAAAAAALLILFSVMLLAIIIYRLSENYDNNKKK